MSKRSGLYPCPKTDTAPATVVSQACAVLLTEIVRTVGALLRAEPALFHRVASDATVSRTIDRLAADPVAALRAINGARAAARAHAWALAGDRAPHHGVDVGARW